MNELIKIQTKGDQQLVSARELHKGLGLKKKFTAWWEQNSKDFEEGTDFVREPESYLTKSGNHGSLRAYDDYLLTIDTAKELCMMSKVPKGKEVRKYFIQVEKKWNSPEEIIKRGYQLLQDENLQLKIENRKLIETNAKQAEKIDRDTDDVLFSHAIRYSNHAIKIRELAAILTQNDFVIGQNQLYQLLRLEHYISKHGTLPMGDKVKRGYFRVVHGVKNDHAWSTTLVTPEGQKHIINKALRGMFDDSYQRVVTEAMEA